MQTLRLTDSPSGRPVPHVRLLGAARNVEPAVYIWAALIVQALVADVVLIRRGKRTLSEVADCHIGRGLRRGLNGHLDRSLVLDPFHLTANVLRRRTP